MRKIFSPLPNIKVDINRLYSEMLYYWHPNLSSRATSASFTTAKNGVPVLIETGKTKHQVIIPKDSIRIHLYYQYYEDIDQT
jgi:hypothetical protein